MKNLSSFLKWPAVLLFIAGGAFVVYGTVKLNRPATTVSAVQSFTLAKGESAAQAIDDLSARGLIKGQWIPRIYLYWTGAGRKFQAGTYELDSAMTIPMIVQILTEGKVKPNAVRFTVVEGWTVADIDRALHDQQILSSAQSIKNNKLEGYLFPDTYIIARDATPQQIIAKIRQNFDKRAPAGLAYGKLIMASIIEREVGRSVKKGTKLTADDYAKIAYERRVVAGIFYNRMKAGLPLDSDATLGYITGNKTGRATNEDLKINSPYNTYKYRGLPPTPISNPSLDSILAALSPAKTDYLYFLTGGGGEAHFAKTLSEHNANRAKYLE